MSETPCEACGGARLNRQALSAKVDGRSVSEVTRMSVEQADDFFNRPLPQGGPENRPPSQGGLQGGKGNRVPIAPENLHPHPDPFPERERENELATIAEPLLRAIRQRLRFLRQVGVDYLTLDRSSATLSGGEFQRIRLATQIGSGLAGVCYVLDEPTIGLHPRDTRKLTEILKQLAAADNTVIAVEHDEEVIAGASYMVDIGPGAGAKGGYLVAQGPRDKVLRHPDSITARFVRGDSAVALPDERRQPDWSQTIELFGVTGHNLKSIDVRFPLGCLVAVTGVSGSGKSTLVDNVLLRGLNRQVKGGGPRPGPFRELRGAQHIDRVAQVDQSPIGRTPRSNPATYVGAFNLIRDLFAKTRESKIRGYGPQRFSFNVKGGRCEMCEGQGVKRVSMHFLPDMYVTCAECNGTRYNRETLEIRYRGKNIADVLNMSIDEAVAFFENFSNIHRRLSALKDCGLGYITLGQASNTLSGGEAQRVKLAGELHKSAETRTIYILDEPTTGLHPADVRNLLTLLQRLVDRTHTVVVIEHNLDVIKSADWVIDLGPEGGDAGGQIVVQGPPETIAACESSHTGQFLRSKLMGKSKE